MPKGQITRNGLSSAHQYGVVMLDQGIRVTRVHPNQPGCVGYGLDPVAYANSSATFSRCRAFVANWHDSRGSCRTKRGVESCAEFSAEKRGNDRAVPTPKNVMTLVALKRA